MFRKIVIHPFLIGLFQVLFLFAENIGEVNFKDIILPLIVIELAVGLLFLLLYFILKNWQEAGNYASVIIIWFFSYGHFYRVFSGFLIGNTLVGRERLMIPFWFLLLLVLLFVLSRPIIRSRAAKLCRALTIIVVILIGLQALKIVAFYSSEKASINPARTAAVKKAPHQNFWYGDKTAVSVKKKDIKSKPNIFYIILDAYSANSSLMSECHYDNSQFTEFLKSRGFYIADKSCSNYPFTTFSLSSSLNMNYLNSMVNTTNRDSVDMGPFSELLEYNLVGHYFNALGYKTIFLGDWWGSNQRSGKSHSPFISLLVESTIFRVFSLQLESSIVRREIISRFKAISELAEERGPLFVFAHILCPHPPFVFGPNGESVDPIMGTIGKALSPQLYLGQIKYLNKLVEKTVDQILKKSSKPPIIIIQADHGAAFIFRPMHNKRVPDANTLKFQFRILNAYYLPNGGRKRLYPSISPVNTFRLILNYYFGQNLPLLPDRSYYSNYRMPYLHRDVTDVVKY